MRGKIFLLKPFIKVVVSIAFGQRVNKYHTYFVSLGLPYGLDLHDYHLPTPTPRSSFETVEEEKPVVAEAAINTQAEKEIASGPRDNNWQEYEDLLTQLCRAQEIQDSVGRDRQVYGHLGGCSEVKTVIFYVYTLSFLCSAWISFMYSTQSLVAWG